jgi:hypothetical protein
VLNHGGGVGEIRVGSAERERQGNEVAGALASQMELALEI